ncbi:hypothetical protein ACGF0J_14425 [Nonomuraea sp. NPDC047897]|uniref:hypothetical protein n=1 Tax=Nonomuraea sp. NPDC047897 TaxID=3364346 RepID=UPI00371C31BC
MTRSRQARRAQGGRFAHAGVLALVLLCLLLAGSAPTSYGGPAQRGVPAGDAWVLGAWDTGLSSTLPQATPTGREHHVPALWPALRAEPAGPVPAARARGLAPDGPRDPQQIGHRAPGSRSPPLI